MIRIRGFAASGPEDVILFDIESRYVGARRASEDGGHALLADALSSGDDGFGAAPTTVRRRYSEFVELHKALVAHIAAVGMSAHITVPKLPPKLGVLGSNLRGRLMGGGKDRELEKRRRSLELFLQEILLIDDLSSTNVFLEFLGLIEGGQAGGNRANAESRSSLPLLPGSQSGSEGSGTSPVESATPTSRRTLTRSLSSFISMTGSKDNDQEMAEANRRIRLLEEQVVLFENQRAALEESLEQSKRVVLQKDALLVQRERRITNLEEIIAAKAAGVGKPKSVRRMFGSDSFSTATTTPNFAAIDPVEGLEDEIDRLRDKLDDMSAEQSSSNAVKVFLESECERLQRHSALRIKSLEAELSVALEENANAREALEELAGVRNETTTAVSSKTPPVTPSKDKKTSSVAASFHRRESERMRTELSALRQHYFYAVGAAAKLTQSASTGVNRHSSNVSLTDLFEECVVNQGVSDWRLWSSWITDQLAVLSVPDHPNAEMRTNGRR